MVRYYESKADKYCTSTRYRRIVTSIATDVAHQRLAQGTIYISKMGTNTYNHNYYCYN
jgi:hypothetical protein